MNKIIFLLFTILFAFYVKGQGLYFDSILPPHINLDNNSLEITISYFESGKHKVKVKINTSKKEIILSAKSLINSSYPAQKIINLKRYENIEDFNVYWLDPDGNKTKIPIYNTNKQDASYYSSVFPFREGNNWFYVDSNLNKISENFDFVLPFDGNFSVVKISDKYALINKSMTLLTQAVFDKIDLQSYGTKEKVPWFSAMKNGKRLQIDTMGQRIYNGKDLLTCGVRTSYSSTLTIYKQDGKMGLIKDMGPQKSGWHYDTIIPAIYDTISRISYEYKENYWLVKLKDKYGVLNNDGNELLPVIYDEVRVGWNIDGELLPTIYNSIRISGYNERWYSPEKEILVCIDNKCGFIDKNYQLFTELKYQNAFPFILGFSIVKTHDGKWGYIDRKGREYWR